MSLYTRIIDLQKLSGAWQRVQKNKPAAGVDNVTYEMFNDNLKMELRQLQMELQNHTYQVLPVRRVTLYKEEKAREIALFSMRDKVVQQSLAHELNKMYDARFTDQTFAYRSNKSALVALDKIEEAIKTRRYKVVLKVDIQKFFDSMQWNIMEGILRKSITEEDVLDLIHQNVMARVLEDTGELVEQTVGFHQGSGIAPVLSNIYLMDFDRWLSSLDVFFIRYSDDILILGESVAQLKGILMEIKLHLSQVGLTVNETKTVCRMLIDGIEFLGHAFNESGKSIPQKAKNSLQERLEIMWLTSEIPFEEKLFKAMQIIGGWEQYFREEREIGSILEFVALLSMTQKDNETVLKLVERRYKLVNIYKDIAVHMGNIWRTAQLPQMELFEYEQICQMPDTSMTIDDAERLEELLAYYRKYMINETEESATEIMQLYTDLRDYEKASAWMTRRERNVERARIDAVPINCEKPADAKLIMNQGTASKVLKILAGREDIYSLESIGTGGKRQVEIQMYPLTEAIVQEHLQGNSTVGTYILRPNNTVKNIVIDVDISKKILLQYNRNTPEFQEYLKRALQKAMEILHIYSQWGIKGYIEYSGCRGYHVWLMFTEWIPVRYANMFCELLEKKLSKDDDLSIEFFPNKVKLKPGKYGQCIKLPFGRHGRTGELAYFLTEEGQCVRDINAFLDSLARYQLSVVKSILAANTDFSETRTQDVELDKDVFGNLPATVSTVLNNCNLMKYLCQKASKTGYLSHFERLSVMYVFGHLGEEGKDFIHTIMALTLNYQSDVTDKFISKIPDKPISCVKLRDQYKSITAEYGCSCNFKRSKNCYPSPVLHAISLSPDISERITIPVSRTLTKENEQKVLDELNIHKKAEELAGKILEFKKQRRKLDNTITKTENELCKIFDSQKIDCLEIEMGLLVRRKTENRYEWLIEL